MTAHTTAFEGTHTPRIVVGVDGSPAGAQALRWAARQSALTGLPLLAVTAWALPDAYGYTWLVADIGDLATDTRTMQDRAIENAVGPDVHVERVVVQGHPADALLRFAGQDDLLVLGSRGHGRLVGALMGSVSQYLVGHAPCPVVVVREAPVVDVADVEGVQQVTSEHVTA